MFGQSSTKAPVTLNVGTGGYVTINGQDYPRNGYFGFSYTYNTSDSLVTIFYTSGDRSIFLKPTRDTFFIWGDTSNHTVRNMNSLRAWFRTNAY